MNYQYQICPVLKNPESYVPDLEDLLTNIPARNYWLKAIEGMVEKFVEKAENLNPDNHRATEDAKICLNKYKELAEKIRLNPGTLINNKSISVKVLLDYNEENLRDYFTDAWKLQKDSETRQALIHFIKRINEIDSIKDKKAKWLELIKGVLAGNVFDWGSSIVANILEESPNFGLNQAMETIQHRPWFIDNADNWINRINNHTYKNVVIFVDNAGVDFILGILPFVRQFLLMGSRVALTANSAPSLNDVTFNDLKLYCNNAAQQCNVLKQALVNGQLKTMENGQKGPCLDFKVLPLELCDFIRDSDLIIIEGMGRAVHTNLYTEFNIECVKIAVLKNQWLAESLGATQFGVVFQYQSN